MASAITANRDHVERAGRGVGRRTSTIVVLALAAVVGIAAARWAGRSMSTVEASPNHKSAPDRVVPVQAVHASVADLQITEAGLGTVVSIHSVTVRSRVSGQLLRVLFHEGETVAEGQLLAEVDPRPFEVQLAQVEGQAAHDQALLDNALLDQERDKTLSQSELISRQQVDAQNSLVRQYTGTTQVDKGLLASAQLQLSFTHITAPTGGRIGLRLIDAGNNITPADATGLAVINEVQPIAVVFSLPEDSVPDIVRRIEAAKKAGRSLPVEAWDRGDKKLVATGALITIDNQIDPTTGTVKLKAEFPNADGTLFPNQFVNVRLLLNVLHDATVIPSRAVQQGSSGPFVYVATPEKAATLRPVELGPVDGANIAIERGVRPGELVVTTGADQLREGAKLALVDSADADPEAPRKAATRPTPRAGP